MPNPTDCATLQSWFKEIDRLRCEIETEWGAGRLPGLVSDDMRARFARQKAKWSSAYQAAWLADVLTADMLAEVETQAGGMRRAYTAMAAAATEAGARPIAPWVWETTLANGQVLAIVQTDDEAAKIIADGRHINVYTLREVACVIDALPEALQIAKVVFPGASVVPPKAWRIDGDEIPF